MPAILFVCLGNICRSPAAENVLRHLATERGVADRLEVDSAGTARWLVDEKPDSRMRGALARRGMPVGGRARQFGPGDFERFDLIVTMDEMNRRDVLRLAPDPKVRAKVRMFCSFCSRPEHAGWEEVPDPYSGGPEGFELVLDLIEDGCAGILDELSDLE